MGTAAWHPKWWTKDQHENAWERVKEALKRDWEQTKADFQGHGKDLNQGVDDTVKQAVGKEVIPPLNQPNPETPHDVTKPIWRDVEEPMKYGYGAREYYGAQYKQWDDNLEGTLKEEWEGDRTHRTWDDVKAFVRRGYERAVH
jgi:hypothetical protein